MRKKPLRPGRYEAEVDSAIAFEFHRIMLPDLKRIAAELTSPAAIRLALEKVLRDSLEKGFVRGANYVHAALGERRRATATKGES